MDERPRDSLEHYMEERALTIALALASTPEVQARIERLADLRTALMEHRRAVCKTAVDTLGLTRKELDAKVKGLYLSHGTSADVLKVHALTYFKSALSSKRHPLEASFAQAWIEAVGDPTFAEEMRAVQRQTEITTDVG